MTDSLGMALSKVLLEHEPKLLVADLDATARATAEVANLLGCLMAYVLVNNIEGYETILEEVMIKINDSAIKTARRSFDIPLNTTPQ